jgi:DNA-binding transcriptional ArsR family regulator
MADQDFDALLRFFKALANENRLRMVGILVERECGVEELATLLDLRAPTVSHHLSKLKELGVVKMRRERNDHLYRLDLDGLHQLSKQVFASFEPGQVADLVDDVAYEAWEKKVLDVFVEGETIQAMPTGYKKRLVVLKWLANHFEQDRRYTEREVNEIIEHHHEDYCMLRREMVDGRLMDRENGVYWRLDWEMPAFES